MNICDHLLPRWYLDCDYHNYPFLSPAFQVFSFFIAANGHIRIHYSEKGTLLQEKRGSTKRYFLTKLILIHICKLLCLIGCNAGVNDFLNVTVHDFI